MSDNKLFFFASDSEPDDSMQFLLDAHLGEGQIDVTCVTTTEDARTEIRSCAFDLAVIPVGPHGKTIEALADALFDAELPFIIWTGELLENVKVPNQLGDLHVATGVGTIYEEGDLTGTLLSLICQHFCIDPTSETNDDDNSDADAGKDA